MALTLGEFRKATAGMPDSADLQPFLPWGLKKDKSGNVEIDKEDCINLLIDDATPFEEDNVVGILVEADEKFRRDFLL